jgi:adenylate cyclase
MTKETAILMADLAGYTALTDIHGGASAAKTINQYVELVQRSISGQSELFQRIGDQVVIISPEAEDLTKTMLQLKQECADQHHFLSIHAGLHYGSIHIENDNLFGSTINITSRLMNLAERDQILCSSAFVERNIPSNEFSFLPKGKIKLKNVLHEVEVYELKKNVEPLQLFYDPVCHMIINLAHPHFHYLHNGQMHYFCSRECLNIFIRTPENFL